MASQNQNQTDAELNALPDSAFFLGLDHVVSKSATFRLGNRILTFVGWQDRKVWDDATDQWVVRNAAGCRPATRDEAIAAGYSIEETATLATAAPKSASKPKRYAIRADRGNGYFAIAGKRQSSAVTTKIEKATIWMSREEAEAALATVAADAPGFFGANQEPVVVEIS